MAIVRRSAATGVAIARLTAILAIHAEQYGAPLAGALHAVVADTRETDLVRRGAAGFRTADAIVRITKLAHHDWGTGIFRTTQTGTHEAVVALRMEVAAVIALH